MEELDQDTFGPMDIVVRNLVGQNLQHDTAKRIYVTSRTEVRLEVIDVGNQTRK